MLRYCMRLVHLLSQLESHDFNVGGVLRYVRISSILFFLYRDVRCRFSSSNSLFGSAFVSITTTHENSLINAVRSAKYCEILSTRISTSEASETSIIFVFNHFYVYCEI